KPSLMLGSVERGAVLSQSSLRELRSYYRALGDVNRLRIVQILVTEGEQPVSELARRLRISQPLMSWHLRRLRRAGIVRMERVGREVRCSFDREKFADLNARGFRLLMNRAEAQACATAWCPTAWPKARGRGTSASHGPAGRRSPPLSHRPWPRTVARRPSRWA